MIEPASCNVPSESRTRPPTAPTPGVSIASTSGANQPGSGSASSFSRTRYTPRALRAPRLQPPAKPRLTPDRTMETPLTSNARSSDTLGSTPFSTTMTSQGTSLVFTASARRHPSRAGAAPAATMITETIYLVRPAWLAPFLHHDDLERHTLGVHGQRTETSRQVGRSARCDDDP